MLNKIQEINSAAKKSGIFSIIGILWAGFVIWKACVLAPFPIGVIFKQFWPASFDPPPLSLLMTDLLGFLSALALLTISFGLGRIIFRRCFRERPSPLFCFVLSAAIGYGILAYLGLLLASVGFCRPIQLRILSLLLFTALLITEYRSWRMPVLSEKFYCCRFFSSLSPGNGLLLAGIIFPIVIAFVMAFVPEIFYDALVYHLGVPNAFLQNGGMTDLPVIYSHLPLTIQMIYMWGLALSGDIATKLTHVVFLVLIALSLTEYGKHLGSTTAGLLAALMFCAIPTVQLNVWTSGNDVAICLFSLLAVRCYSAYRDQGPDHIAWLAFSALFSGLAVSSKYTLGLIPLFLGAHLLHALFRDGSPPAKKIKKAALFFGLVLAVFLPWGLKNAVQTGNPFYPVLSARLGSGSAHQIIYQAWKSSCEGPALSSIKDWLYLPWKISLLDRSSMGFQGPMILALLFFWLPSLWEKKNQAMRLLVLLSFGTLLTGFLLTRFTRYLLCYIALLMPVLTVGISNTLAELPAAQKKLFFGLLGALYFIQMSWTVARLGSAFHPGDVLWGRISSYDFLVQDQLHMRPNPSFQMYQYLDSGWDRHNKILIIGDEKAYPIHVPHSYSSVFDVNPLAEIADKSASAGDIATRLNKLGITHLLINENELHRLAGGGMFPWSDQGRERFGEFWRSHLSLEHWEDVRGELNYHNRLFLFRVSGTPLQANPVDNFLLHLNEKKT